MELCSNLIMISIYEYRDFREYLKELFKQVDTNKESKLTASSLARSINVSTSLMSQVLSGDKQFNPDQAFAICDFLKLKDHEIDYFLLMIEWDRAAHHKLKARLEKKMHLAEERARKIETRVTKDFELSDESKAIYYSSWLYTGVRNLTAIGSLNDVKALANYLQVSEVFLEKVINFLIQEGLCKNVDGNLTYGPAHTHLSVDSPLVTKHHQNWRLRAFQKMELRSQDDLFYTCPMSLSNNAALQIRKLLPQIIEDILKITGPSPSEDIRRSES